MRRALAAAVLGISLWLGSLAWTGFVLLRTVLDPERSREVAETLYADEAVRSQLADSVAAAVEGALPDDAGVERSTIQATAQDALASPEVEAIFVDALADAHAAFLGEGDVPRSVDADAFGAAARRAAVGREPSLDAVLPAAPTLEVPLPTAQLPNAGPVRDAIATAVPLLALAAVTGVVLSLLVTSNRPAVVRRAGVWAVGLSATVLIGAYAVPFLAEALLPGRATVVAALVRAMAEATRVPALALAGTGLAAVVVSVGMRRASAPRLPAERGRQPPARRREAARRDLPRPVRRTWSNRPPSAGPRPDASGPVPGRVVAGPSGSGPAPTRVSVAPTTGTDGSVTSAGPAATRVQPSVAAAPVTPAADPTVAEGEPRRTRWVDGVGWVLEASAAIPPEARWVPGVGYVLDER